MRYEVNVDNDRQVMLVLDKDLLDSEYDYVMSVESSSIRLGFLYALMKIGLLDDDFRPNWR